MDYPNLLDNAYKAAQYSATPLIWRQLHWTDRRPVLEVELTTPNPDKSHTIGTATPTEAHRPTGTRVQIPLTPGAYLGMRIPHDTSGTPHRYCNGYTTGNTPHTDHPTSQTVGRNTGSTPGINRIPCPEGNRIERGQQCPRCATRDEFTALHSAHLYPGTLTEGMRAYAMLEHRLYIATFPDGTHKVGTSSLTSTPRRLDEQAVATATYIALAPDGLTIRRAEDAVTALAALPQVKQVASKYRAWTKPLPGPSLRAAHQEALTAARAALATLTKTEPNLSLSPLDEPWVPSPAMNRPYAALRATSPEPLAPCLTPDGRDAGLDGGVVGFFCTGATGQFISAHTGDADAAFLINTAAWRNLLIEPEQGITQVSMQGSLF